MRRPPGARWDEASRAAVLAVGALLYWAGYVGYLWRTQENEVLHWLSLVLIPFGLLTAAYLLLGVASPLRTLARDCGLRARGVTRGVPLAVAVGLVGSVAQLVLSERRAKAWEILTSPQALIVVPLAFVMLVVTAAFTEEFFFRGVLQVRLRRWRCSAPVAIAVSAVAFGAYHLPYAYLSPQWSTHGDLAAALGECLLAAVAGAIFGWVFERSGHNLAAAVVCHALLDTLPAITQLTFSVQMG